MKTEDILAVISETYYHLAEEYPILRETANNMWREKFAEWTTEYKEILMDSSLWPKRGYPYNVETFAKQKIYEFAEIPQSPFYFTFGSWRQYPYQNTYLIVYGNGLNDAIRKFRCHFKDINEGIVNCSFWYNKENWEKLGCYKNKKPAEIIW